MECHKRGHRIAKLLIALKRREHPHVERRRQVFLVESAFCVFYYERELLQNKVYLKAKT